MALSLRIPTPAAPRRTHLFAAALMWSTVGLALMAVGARWTVGSGSSFAAPALFAAAAVGLVKARYVLGRTARRIVKRIDERGDGRCLGGFLSWKSWLLVGAMVGLGRLLRMSPLPLLLRGAIYFAIGAALLAASRGIWEAWGRTPRSV